MSENGKNRLLFLYLSADGNVIKKYVRTDVEYEEFISSAFENGLWITWNRIVPPWRILEVEVWESDE